MQREIFIIIFVLQFGISFSRPRRKETVTQQPITVKYQYESNNHSNIPIDVRLQDISTLNSRSGEADFTAMKSNHTGLIKITMPRSPENLFMCYPENENDRREAYTFAHVVCRQLGFMTLETINRKELPLAFNKRFHRLSPRSYKCTGQEQSTSHCKWNNLNVSSCQVLAELTCGECRRKLDGYSGMMKTPGFPLVYTFDTTCEWDVKVPEGHTIALSFPHLDAVFPDVSQFCSLNKPYIEIVYGTPGRMTLRRYCSLREMKNISIPFYDVKLRLFTGLYSQPELHTQENEKGIAIYFKAIQTLQKSNGWQWKLTFLVVFVFTVITTILICHLCQKHKFEKSKPVLPVVNTPNVEDIDTVFEKCKINNKENRGLRLRSNGSSAKHSRIFFPSSDGAKSEMLTVCHEYPVDTPKSIPDLIISDGIMNQQNSNFFFRVKANLLDRYSKGSSRSASVSNRISASSPVFLPVGPSFQIYTSESVDPREVKKLPPPLETAL